MAKSICYLTGLYSRYDVLIYARQGCSLASEGYKVSIVACDTKPNETIDGVEIISSGYDKPNNRFNRMLNTQKYLYKKAIEVDAEIYQISEPELILLGLRLKKKGKKVIFNMRENYASMVSEKEYLPKLLRKPISIILNQFMKKSLSRYDAVFSVDQNLVDIVKQNWGISNSYLLANFPIISEGFYLSKDEYLAKPNVLCYVGTIYRISRQELVFKALENIPDISYLIAGIVDEGYNHTISVQKYWSRVKFINGFKKSELPNIFAQSTISNILRDFTNTGTPNGSLGVIKMFESMEAALPIICSDVQINKEIIEKYNCGICVDPNNVDDIEKAIRYLIENKEEAYQMGQNGRRAVIEKYNWGSQAKTYIEVLNKI